MLEKIEKQTFRAARIVNGLLNLSRPASADDSRAYRRSTSTPWPPTCCRCSSTSSTRAGCKVRRELSATPVLVVGFEFKLQQVFLNLFLNARDAMPSGGWLTIATRVDGGRAVAEVRDTGSGVSPEHLARIYDPFFTTKGTGQRHRARPVDHLRHRAGARRHDPVRERRRPGHALHARVSPWRRADDAAPSRQEGAGL